MKRDAFAALGLFMVVALVQAGQACPDPYQYFFQEGACKTNPVGMPYPQAPVLRQGGCQSPGTSSVECGIHHFEAYVRYPIATYDPIFGEICTSCAMGPVQNQNFAYGVNLNDRPCDYGRCDVEVGNPD